MDDEDYMQFSLISYNGTTWLNTSSSVNVTSNVNASWIGYSIYPHHLLSTGSSDWRLTAVNGTKFVNQSIVRLTYRPNPNFNGYETLVAEVSDHVSSESRGFLIEVIAVNDPPLIAMMNVPYYEEFVPWSNDTDWLNGTDHKTNYNISYIYPTGSQVKVGSDVGRQFL